MLDPGAILRIGLARRTGRLRSEAIGKHRARPVVGLFGSQNNQLATQRPWGWSYPNKPIERRQRAQKKSPLPDEAAQAKALKLAKEVYGEEWTAAKTPSQKRELGDRNSSTAADESENDPPAATSC